MKISTFHCNICHAFYYEIFAFKSYYMHRSSKLMLLAAKTPQAPSRSLVSCRQIRPRGRQSACRTGVLSDTEAPLVMQCRKKIEATVCVHQAASSKST